MTIQQSPRTWEGSGQRQGRHDPSGREHVELGVGNPERKLGLFMAGSHGRDLPQEWETEAEEKSWGDPRVCREYGLRE